MHSEGAMPGRWVVLFLVGVVSCDADHRRYCVENTLHAYSRHEGWESVPCDGACVEANGAAECVVAPLRACSGPFCEDGVIHVCGDTGYVSWTTDCNLEAPWADERPTCISDGGFFCAFEEPRCPAVSTLAFCSADGTRLYLNCEQGYPTDVLPYPDGQVCATPPPADGVPSEPRCLTP